MFNIIYTPMSKVNIHSIFTQYSLNRKYYLKFIILALFSLVISQNNYAQITVDIPCTGANNPNSGRVTNSGSKSYGYLQWNNSVGSGGTYRAAWARFNIQTYI